MKKKKREVIFPFDWMDHPYTLSAKSTQREIPGVIKVEEGVYDEEKMEQTIRRAAEFGADALYVYIRMCDGGVCMHSKLTPSFPNDAANWGMREALNLYDPPEVAVRYGHKYGLRVYLCHHPYDKDGAPFLVEHPEYQLEHKDGGKFFPGIPCYAEPGVLEYMLAHIQELSNYGADGIYLRFWSHSPVTHKPQGDPEGVDVYGFNPPVVEEFKKRYGVDIRREPFKPELLHTLNGEYLTNYLRAIKDDILRPKGQELHTDANQDYGCQIKGWGYKNAQITINHEWKKWVEEGIADALVGFLTDRKFLPSFERAKKVIKDQAKLYATINSIPASDKRDPEERLAAAREIRDLILAARDCKGIDGVALQEICTYEYETDIAPILCDGARRYKEEEENNRVVEHFA